MRGKIVGAVLCAGLVGCNRGDAGSYAGFVDAPTAAVAAEVAGKVAEVPVREGDRVEKGQLIAKLDARERSAFVVQAEANVERANAALRTAEENLRATTPTVRGAGADIARAQATLGEARISYDRTARLVEANAISASELDLARAHMQEAQATLDGMFAGKAQVQGHVAAALSSVDDARAAVRSSEAALALTKVQLDQAEIRAPFDAIVVDVNLRAGEWAAPGVPVVTVEDRNQTWVRLDVPEDRLGQLALGRAAAIYLAPDPARAVRGHVVEVGEEGDFAVNRDVKRGRADIRTFRVRVGFDEKADLARPGMTAEVRLGASP